MTHPLDATVVTGFGFPILIDPDLPRDVIEIRHGTPNVPPLRIRIDIDKIEAAGADKVTGPDDLTDQQVLDGYGPGLVGRVHIRVGDDGATRVTGVGQRMAGVHLHIPPNKIESADADKLESATPTPATAQPTHTPTAPSTGEVPGGRNPASSSTREHLREMLCGRDGMVRGGPFHQGVDYPCTGSAHGLGMSFQCINPVHWSKPAPLLGFHRDLTACYDMTCLRSHNGHGDWKSHACPRCNRPLHVTSGPAKCRACIAIIGTITMNLGPCTECGTDAGLVKITTPENLVASATPTTPDLLGLDAELAKIDGQIERLTKGIDTRVAALRRQYHWPEWDPMDAQDSNGRGVLLDAYAGLGALQAARANLLVAIANRTGTPA